MPIQGAVLCCEISLRSHEVHLMESYDLQIWTTLTLDHMGSEILSSIDPIDLGESSDPVSYQISSNDQNLE
jgi:hypothetical protein